jgi:hypothetical protein
MDITSDSRQDGNRELAVRSNAEHRCHRLNQSINQQLLLLIINKFCTGWQPLHSSSTQPAATQ